MLFRPDEFESEFGILPDDYNGRTNAGKALKAEMELKYKGILKKEELYDIQAMSKSVKEHHLCSDLFIDCKFQVAIFWIDEKTGLKCKGLADMVGLPPLNCLIDVKKVGPSKGASSYNLVKMFQSQYEEHFYDGQIAYYTRGLESNLDERIQYKELIAVSSVPPYDVLVVEPATDDLDYCNNQIDLALSKYKELKDKTMGPAYPERKTFSRRPFAKKGLESEMLIETI
jgi:hypothetical protein